MKSFLISATLLLSGAAMGDTSIEMNSGKPQLVSFEEAQQVFEFHALRLTHRERPDVLVTMNLCPFQKGVLRATLLSFDGAKYRPAWVLDTG